MKIKIANNIWQYSPTSGELQVYISLATFTNRFGFCAVKLHTLAERAGVSVATVARAIEGLDRKGLISIKNRYNYEGDRIANGYFLTPIGGKFTLVDSAILNHNLPKSVLKVYIYLMTCRHSKTLEALPSLSKMVAMLHMSKRTIIDSINHLTKALLLTKENYKRKTDNRLGHNRYRILTGQVRLLLIILLMKAGIKKRLGAAPSYNATPNFKAKLFKCTYNIACSIENVKLLYHRQSILFRNFIGTILSKQELYAPKLRLQLRI